MAVPTRRANRDIRPIHRVIGSLLMLFALYFAVTGTAIQVIDLRAIFTNAPATDPEMIQMREGFDGPKNFVVIQAGDYAAAPLPARYDYDAALATVMTAARRTLGASTPLKFVELRTIDGRPTSIVRRGEDLIRFDPGTGTVLASSPARGPAPRSLHLAFKILHTGRLIGNWIAFVDIIVAASLFAATVTGLLLYFRLLRSRRQMGRPGLFWSAGGPWRTLHRTVSLLSALFLLIISGSGTLLGIDAFGLGLYQVTHRDAGKYAQFPQGSVGDFSSPLPDAALPAMMRTTLAAEAAAAGKTPIKVVRLRFFNGIPQGVVIAGGKGDATQRVFHARTGTTMRESESDYPRTHYYFGWEEHEFMKNIHRGDAFGVSGRVMHCLAGFALIFLSVSGGLMYLDLWSRRRAAGRPGLFWR